jgi:hypothetical protein
MTPMTPTREGLEESVGAGAGPARVYSGWVPLVIVEASHARVICNGCREATAELCGRRELAVSVRLSAVPKFKKAGWHHDAGDYGRVRSLEGAQREGTGRWYCPGCAPRTHL